MRRLRQRTAQSRRHSPSCSRRCFRPCPALCDSYEIGQTSFRRPSADSLPQWISGIGQIANEKTERLDEVCAAFDHLRAKAKYRESARSGLTDVSHRSSETSEPMCFQASEGSQMPSPSATLYSLGRPTVQSLQVDLATAVLENSSLGPLMHAVSSSTSQHLRAAVAHHRAQIAPEPEPMARPMATHGSQSRSKWSMETSRSTLHRSSRLLPPAPSRRHPRGICPAARSCRPAWTSSHSRRPRRCG